MDSLPDYQRCDRVHHYWLSTFPAIGMSDIEILFPENEAAVVEDARACIKQKEHLAAIQLLTALCRRLWQNADIEVLAPYICWIVYLQLECRNIPAARKQLRELLIRTAPSPLILRTTGVVEILSRQYAQGMEHLRTAVQLNPEDGPSWACIAIVYGLIREHWQAEIAARNALRNKLYGRVNLVGLTLMQATLEQGKPVEGAFDFELGCSQAGSTDDLLQALPPVDSTALVHPSDSPLIIFISCDHCYFLEYAIPLILSIAASGTACTLHLHVINPGQNLAAMLQTLRERIAPLRLIVSTESAQVEQFGPANMYYATIRYCRLYQLLAANAAPVVMLDADMIVRRDLGILLGASELRSVGLCRQPEEPIWQEMVAAMGYYQPDHNALEFAGDAARFIAHNLLCGKGSWFLDQVAIYAAWRKHREKIPFRYFNAEDVYDIEHRDGATIWTLDANKRLDSKMAATQRELLALYQFPNIEPANGP